MSQGEKPQSRGWLKNVLRFIAILLFLFLALTAIGIFATQYLQNVDIRAWLLKRSGYGLQYDYYYMVRLC